MRYIFACKEITGLCKGHFNTPLVDHTLVFLFKLHKDHVFIIRYAVAPYSQLFLVNRLFNGVSHKLMTWCVIIYVADSAFVISVFDKMPIELFYKLFISRFINDIFFLYPSEHFLIAIHIHASFRDFFVCFV